MNIRKATEQDAPGIARVHIDSWRTTYKGIVPDDFLDSLNYEDRTKRWEQNVRESNVYVAENDTGKIFGFSTGGKEREEKYGGYDGELYAIYILEEYQGKGIGKKLVKPVADELSKAGFNSMLVWVLEENDAKYFYEKLGGKYIDTADITIDGAELKEMAYGWPDLNVLTKEG
ncbi:GNAT family N-acetyltransferase [Lentibacillus amyloliquefaciens]|uniref:GNAT family acetyltransferase n=1 Tax=Lentibacillus amyloliquefaciens TaxID=1472767 RepID=A0A0U4F037_9BACI|nr:GNAT family N-acetyltransferase [Lentibacillus amyloliquefaciens]ALX48887.1 GNAT family acetyltransferase [Lentibacillus amyloliquefaciens]